MQDDAGATIRWLMQAGLVDGATFAARALTHAHGWADLTPTPQPCRLTVDSWLRAARRCVGDEAEQQQQQQILPTLPMSCFIHSLFFHQESR
jgi:hypothetical protein